jgi:hypothetical protein
MKSLSLLAVAVGATLLFSAPLHAQAAQTVKCKDGSTSKVIGRGACENHGGVAKADKGEHKAAVKAEKKEEKEEKRKSAEGAVAKCKDGSYSHAKSAKGACGKHGGVAEVLKP